jgi:hypothetical protein
VLGKEPLGVSAGADRGFPFAAFPHEKSLMVHADKPGRLSARHAGPASNFEEALAEAPRRPRPADRPGQWPHIDVLVPSEPAAEIRSGRESCYEREGSWPSGACQTCSAPVLRTARRPTRSMRGWAARRTTVRYHLAAPGAKLTCDHGTQSITELFQSRSLRHWVRQTAAHRAKRRAAQRSSPRSPRRQG